MINLALDYKVLINTVSFHITMLNLYYYYYYYYCCYIIVVVIVCILFVSFFTFTLNQLVFGLGVMCLFML